MVAKLKNIWESVREYFRKHPFRLKDNMALITGLLIGILAAVVQGFFDVQPPVGAGICAVSHPANLINWITNRVFGTSFTIHSIFVSVPVLTSVGFILGSFIAAMINHEFKIRKGPVRDNVMAFILGFMVIVFGLLWGSCPIRTAVLASYGMVFAWVVLGAIVLGVIVACEYIKWKVRR